MCSSFRWSPSRIRLLTKGPPDREVYEADFVFCVLVVEVVSEGGARVVVVNIDIAVHGGRGLVTRDTWVGTEVWVTGLIRDKWD